LFDIYSFLFIYNIDRGDAVAKWTKASVVTHPGAGSNLGSRAAFFFGQVVASGEQVPPSLTRAWQIPTGAHLKICQNYTYVFTPTVPSLTL